MNVRWITKCWAQFFKIYIFKIYISLGVETAAHLDYLFKLYLSKFSYLHSKPCTRLASRHPVDAAAYAAVSSGRTSWPPS